MLSGRQATHLASAALDRHLGLRERLGLRAQLMICAGCAQFERQLGLLRGASKRLANGAAAAGDDADDEASGGNGPDGRGPRRH